MDGNNRIEVIYDPAATEELVKEEHEVGYSEDMCNYGCVISDESVKKENVSDENHLEYEDLVSCEENEMECEDSDQEVELKPIVAVDVSPFCAEYDNRDEDKSEEEVSLSEKQVKIVKQLEEEYAVKETCGEKYTNWLQSKSKFNRSDDALITANTHPKQHRPFIGNSSIECGICSEEFMLITDLKKHVKDHKRETAVKCRTWEPPYKCGVCKKGFISSGGLTIHMRTHTGETPYKCSVCKRGFKSSSDLTIHKRMHTGETPYTCSVCKKGFKATSHLTTHMRTHTGETPYNCSVCKKGLKSSGSITIHMRTHTGETPYKCSVCKRGFKSLSVLTIHKRTHTGETPYKCSVCKKGFKSSGDLTRHMRTHTGETPYNCCLCKKGFKEKRSLITHLQVHTRESS